MKSLFLTLCLVASIHDGAAASKIAPALQHLAGEYYFSNGLGVNCTLRVDGGGQFKFQWRGCRGVYEDNHGNCTLQDGVVMLTPQKLNVRGGSRGMPTEFFPVPWGSRMYLVPTNGIVEFCSDVNQGGEPRSAGPGRFYLRKGDVPPAAKNKPEVPAAWDDFLLKKSVSGSVTEIINAQEAWVDRGARHGIRPGMILVVRGGSQHAPVRVEAVEKNRCRVQCRLADTDLVIGQSISSRFYN